MKFTHGVLLTSVIAMVACGNPKQRENGKHAFVDQGVQVEKTMLTAEQKAQAEADAKKIQEAKAILAKYSTGQEVLTEIEKNNQYGQAIEIQLADFTETSKQHKDRVGYVKVGNNGKFSIVADRASSAETLAHILAHESRHVIDNGQENQFLSKYPELAQRIDISSTAFKSGDKDAVAKLPDLDVRFISTATFCGELRAFSRNIKLDSEGLNYTNPDFKDGEALTAFIDRIYLSPLGITLTSEADDLSKKCLEAKDMTDFHKQTLSILKEIK